MKILMLCGSPRPKDSNSLYLLNALEEKLQGEDILVCHVAKSGRQAEKIILENLPDSDVLVVAFPLYVDGLPSHLLGVLKMVEEAKIPGKAGLKVYGIVNNGFYDARQNSIAIAMLWRWCEKCGFSKGYAMGVGAGEMMKAAPLGVGPSVNLGRALTQFAADIRTGAVRETLFVEPNFPRFLYRQAGHMGWRGRAKKNGVKCSAIRRKLKWEDFQK